MKRKSYIFTRKIEEASACSPKADYDNAMKVYKLFAYVSGGLITVAYLVAQLF